MIRFPNETIVGYCRAYWVITAPLMQDNITLNSALVCEFLSSSPSPSLFLISAISCVFCQCEIPLRFGRIHEISAIRHLLRLLCSFFWQQIWALLLLCSNYWERKPRQFFGLLSAREIYNKRNSRKHFNLLKYLIELFNLVFILYSRASQLRRHGNLIQRQVVVWYVLKSVGYEILSEDGSRKVMNN